MKPAIRINRHFENTTAAFAAPVPAVRVSRLVCAVGQAALFLAIYGGCLTLTTGRPDVGQHFWSWEMNIPLVPPMILPYFSIYPLFFLSFFVCTGAGELRAHTYRLSLCQLVAGVCYLMFPLECAFERPQLDGFYGMMFQLLDATDRPYNLAPSLHVATAVIVGTVLAGKARGIMRPLAIFWCTLIAISTMLTWQHHLLDVIAGATLGMACVRTFATNVAMRPRC